MIELYAITDDATPPEPPVRAVRSDGLTALYAPSDPRDATLEDLRRLAASLDRVRGAAELAVRAHPRRQDADPPARGGSGHDYMSGKARQLEAARAVHEPLAQVARDSVIRPGPELLRAAYLVDRGAVERFVAVVRRLQDAHAGLDVLCTGPWPPYSFAEGGKAR